MAGSTGEKERDGEGAGVGTLARETPRTSGKKAMSSRSRSPGDVESAAPGVRASAEGRQQRAIADARPKTGAPEGLPDLRSERDLLLRAGDEGLGVRCRTAPGSTQSVGWRMFPELLVT